MTPFMGYKRFAYPPGGKTSPRGGPALGVRWGAPILPSGRNLPTLTPWEKEKGLGWPAPFVLKTCKSFQFPENLHAFKNQTTGQARTQHYNAASNPWCCISSCLTQAPCTVLYKCGCVCKGLSCPIYTWVLSPTYIPGRWSLPRLRSAISAPPEKENCEHSNKI